jgi:CHAT domain-containing protein
MRTFYSRLVAGEAKDEALRQAQLALLEPSERGADARQKHPYYWAAFSLMGDYRAVWPHRIFGE